VFSIPRATSGKPVTVGGGGPHSEDGCTRCVPEANNAVDIATAI
jgi:hypothetical protein